MSMSIADEAMGLDVEETQGQEVAQEAGEQGVSFLSFVGDLFRVETGPGKVEDYQDNPLCFDGSVGLAQVLRGVSGFAGANLLRSAILDIVVGIMRWVSPAKGEGAKPGA